MMKLRRSATLAVTLLVACDGGEPKGAGAPEASASAAPSATAPAPVSTLPTWKVMPEIVVDENGIAIAGRAIDLKKRDGLQRLRDIIERLPMEGKPVVVQADRKASTKTVALLVEELGAKGAPAVVLKTSGRGDLPKEISVTPRSRITDPAPCSIVTSVTEDLSTGVWPLRGGGGKRYRKGFAGPDLTSTGETLVKELKACDSKTAFFAANDKHAWELCFNMGALLVKSDEDKKIDKLVLLGEEPVAGRAVKLEGG